VVSEILDKRPNPPSAEQRAKMLQPDDIAAAALMVACLPPRAHVTEIIMTGALALPWC
jgi:NADP-dependent 3-hydroxy acid dehydrogenase YdfG